MVSSGFGVRVGRADIGEGSSKSCPLNGLVISVVSANGTGMVGPREGFSGRLCEYGKPYVLAREMFWPGESSSEA